MKIERMYVGGRSQATGVWPNKGNWTFLEKHTHPDSLKHSPNNMNPASTRRRQLHKNNFTFTAIRLYKT